MEQEWIEIKDIEGDDKYKIYGDGYFVSNFGNVESYRKNKDGRPMVIQYTTWGDAKISMTKIGPSEPGEPKGKNFYIKRLVADAFLPNPQGFHFVKTIDGNKKNCRVDNLQWVNEHSKNKKHTSHLCVDKPSRPPTKSQVKRHSSGRVKDWSKFRARSLHER